MFAQSSIRAEPLLSLQARSFKNKVEDEIVVALTPSLLTCRPHANYQSHETLFERSMFCASSANYCSTDELVPPLDERDGVGSGELRAANGFWRAAAGVRGNINIYTAQASWTTATDEG